MQRLNAVAERENSPDLARQAVIRVEHRKFHHKDTKNGDKTRSNDGAAVEFELNLRVFVSSW